MGDGYGSLATGRCLLVRMPGGSLVTGDVSQVATFGFLGIGYMLGDVIPWQSMDKQEKE